MMIECNCKLNNIWPFPVSHCEHGKKLLPDALNKLTIISNKKDNTIPDSVMNIIRGNNK